MNLVHQNSNRKRHLVRSGFRRQRFQSRLCYLSSDLAVESDFNSCSFCETKYGWRLERRRRRRARTKHSICIAGIVAIDCFNSSSCVPASSNLPVASSSLISSIRVSLAGIRLVAVRLLVVIAFLEILQSICLIAIFVSLKKEL